MPHSHPERVAGPVVGPVAAGVEERVWRRITWRVMPVLFACYILAYLDRVNVGFGKLQMQGDLRMSDTAYGAGAGVFFLGYLLFEVPANVLLRKFGARCWLGSIIVCWGLLSAATALIHNSAQFYLLRFLLGTVESGFFPGVILYLTFWYTSRHRARMVAVFMSAIPLSGVVGGPVSGWILSHMATTGGLHGWQWLFLLEGLPSVLAGAVAMGLLDDGPVSAKWLSPAEKQSLLAEISAEEQAKRTSRTPLHSFRDAFSSRLVWLFCAIFFGFASGSYGLGFWLPQLIADRFAATAGRVGLLSAIPWAAGTAAMLLVGRHSDRTGERRWHIAGSGLVGGLSFALASLPGIGAAASLAALSCAAAGIMVTISLFWSLPTAILSSAAAAAGIAWINSVGSLSGYVCPMLIGLLRERWGSMTPALLALAAASIAASTAVLWALPAQRNRYSEMELVNLKGAR